MTSSFRKGLSFKNSPLLLQLLEVHSLVSSTCLILPPIYPQSSGCLVSLSLLSFSNSLLSPSSVQAYCRGPSVVDGFYPTLPPVLPLSNALNTPPLFSVPSWCFLFPSSIILG